MSAFLSLTAAAAPTQDRPIRVATANVPKLTVLIGGSFLCRDSDGEVRDRIQTNGKCENANPLGDTYGPVNYLAYVPASIVFPMAQGWARDGYSARP